MITRREIEDLSSFHTHDHLIVSLYLNLGKGKPSEGTHTIHFKNLLSQIEAQSDNWTRAQADSVARDLERIRIFVRDQQVTGGRGLAVFACDSIGLWQTYIFGRAMGNLIYIGHDTYVKPLFRMLQRYQPHCTVLVGKGRARIFLFSLDSIEERSDIFGAVPGRHDQGGWAQARLQRHHDDRVMHHLKNTADVLLSLHQEEEFGRLIVAGTDELVSQFQEYLHPYLKKRLVATLPMSMLVSPATVKKRSLAILRETTAAEYRKILETAISEAGAQNLGVLGLAGTLRALQRGQVQTLLVNEDFEAVGQRCLGCGHLTIRDDERCSYCEGELEPVAEIVAEIIDLAYNQDCEVKFMRGDNAALLAEYGHIGALLRYAVRPE